MSRDLEPRRNNPVIFLSALLEGREVKLGQQTYRLFRAGESFSTSQGLMEAVDLAFMMKASRIVDGEAQEIWLGSPLGFADFIAAAEAESFDAGFLMAAESVLRQEAKSRNLHPLDQTSY